MSHGLTAKEIKLIKDVFKKNSAVERVFIHGSRARGDFKKTSDIDFAVKFFGNDKNLILQLHSELDDLPVIYEIDIIDEKEIGGKNFKDNYEKSKKEFYKKSK